MPEQNNERERIADNILNILRAKNSYTNAIEQKIELEELSFTTEGWVDNCLAIADWHISKLNSAVVKARKETAEEIFDCTYDNSYIDKLTGETEYSEKCKEIISSCNEKLGEKRREEKK